MMYFIFIEFLFQKKNRTLDYKGENGFCRFRIVILILFCLVICRWDAFVFRSIRNKQKKKAFGILAHNFRP